MRDSGLQSPRQLADHKANTSVKWQAPSLRNPRMAWEWRYSVSSTKASVIRGVVCSAITGEHTG